MSEHKEIVLVTGAGSGFGLATTLLLASSGYRVFGSVLNAAEADGLRREAAARGVSVEILQMDVTHQDQIDAAVAALMAAAGRIDAVVQYAGLGLRGFFEDLEMDEIRRLYDVNVFGVMAVTKALLPIMRRQRSGKIVVTTSAAGRMGTMSIGGYCSGKFAIEGMAECLRQEMWPFNVWVSCIEPGLVATPHFSVNRNRARKAVSSSTSPYYLWFCQHEKIVDDIMAKNRWGVEEVAATALRILRSKRPPLHNIVGFKAKLLINLKRYSPFEWFETWYWGIVRKMVTQPKVQATTLSGLEYQLQGMGHGSEKSHS